MVRLRTTEARKRALKAVRLAKRDREVTAAVGGLGYSYKTTGRKLGIATSTARWYARELTRKIGSSRPPQEALARLFLVRQDELGTLASTLDAVELV